MRILIDNALKSDIMLTWKYFIIIDIKGKHNVKLFTIYTYCRNGYQQGSEILQT